VERQAEILKDAPAKPNKAALQRQAAHGRRVLERYLERLGASAQRLRHGPEAAELFCAQAELFEGYRELNSARAVELYGRAIDAFSFSRPAHLGLRRLARRAHDAPSTIAALQRELGNASPERAKLLQKELIRTYLYQADKAGEALKLLESLEEQRLAALRPKREPKAPSIQDALEGETPETAEKPSAVATPPSPWRGAEDFFLWEDTLWASAQWKRYEELLRDALAHHTEDADFTRLVERRLLHLYQSILPDRKQADIILEHLVEQGKLDPELVELALRRYGAANRIDDIVDLLSEAINDPLCAEHETIYRMILADIARHHFDDIEHAINIIRDGLEKHPQEAILVAELLSLHEEKGDPAGLVDALGSQLELAKDGPERAEILFRIGTLLAEALEVPEAAEEVFADAVRENPQHRGAVRALGKLLHAREDWRALAALYEAELDAHDESCVWPKSLTLAELYEEKLADPERAFALYAGVLEREPAYLPALKGASRVVVQLGKWVELMQLYANAEAASHDPKQNAYLLERIAQIAEEQLGDLETAAIALEGLRAIDPRHPAAVSGLARLCARLGKFDTLIALTDDEVSWTEDANSAAALLVRNGELCDEQLNDPERAKQYYRRALERLPGYLPALENLGRLLQRQGEWKALVELGLAEVETRTDDPDALRRLHAVAEILELRLEERDEAIKIYWRCLERDPNDSLARHALVRLLRLGGNWEELCKVLEIESKQSSNANPGATLFRLGQIREHRLSDAEGALDAYRRAFLADPDNAVLLHAWLAAARKSAPDEETRKQLANAAAKPKKSPTRADLLLALAELTLSESHDPLSAAGFYEKVLELAPQRESIATLLAMAFARSGRWAERTGLAIAQHRGSAERRHAFEAALVQGLPEALRAHAQAMLPTLDTSETELTRIWGLFFPELRPSPLPELLRKSVDPDAQDLRRWVTIQCLLSGESCEPSLLLLPEISKHALTLRPDLELLAAYFELGETHAKLLEVFAAQEEMAPNEAERAALSLERAKVLEKAGKPEKALGVVRACFEYCRWDEPLREELYAYLEEHGDWEALVAELRRHLMHIEDPALQSKLWLRLSSALEHGVGELREALRALDAAYRCFPADGTLLKEIARVAEELGESSIARRAIDDFLQYHQPPIEAELDVASRLVELHLRYPGGDPRRVIAYLEDLAHRSAEDERVLRALATAHGSAGDAYVAVDILLRLCHLPYREEELELWLQLAEVYGRQLGEKAKAEDLLWELFGVFPSKSDVWQAIDDFYPGREARARLAARLDSVLSRAVELGFERRTQRHYLTILGQIVGEELGQWKQAQVYFSDAIELAEVPTPELSRQRALAMCKIPTERDAAFRGFAQLLAENPIQPDILELAIGICDEAEAYDRARILRQIAALFVPEAGLHETEASGRPKIDVNRQLDDSVLQQRLLHPSLRPIHELLHEALPIVEAVYGEQIPKLSVLGGARLRSRDEAAESFATIATRLGLSGVRVFLGENEAPTPMVFASPPAFWIPDERWTAMGAAERRHWAGYAAGLLWTGVAPMVYLDGRELWQLLDGVHYLVTGNGIEGRTAYTIEASEKVKSPWYRRARKEISALIVKAGEAVGSEDSHQWTGWLRATGDRAGLLFSGDVGSSIRAALAGDGWLSGELDASALKAQLERNPRLRDMLSFALSDDYLHLRHSAGLGPRPSSLAR
jgi:tetratricopeptide (TPR) repeat protein